jgi:tryptophan halogenase
VGAPRAAAAGVVTGWPARICVVGGGTAGWLAAMMLTDVAGKRSPGTTVTVVESSRIGVIGVGEGSTAIFRQMLRRFGLDEEEFLRETGATVKLGIRHRDWRRLGHHYDGPIDNPGLVAPGVPLDAYAVAAGRPVQEAHLFQHLIDRERGPYALVDGRHVPAGPFHHAFHFDQARVGAWLRRKAKGVKLIDDQVWASRRAGQGWRPSSSKAGAGSRRTCSWTPRGSGGLWSRRCPSSGCPSPPCSPTTARCPSGCRSRRARRSRPSRAPGRKARAGCGASPRRTGTAAATSTATPTCPPTRRRPEIERALGRRIEPRGDIRIDPGRQRNAWVGNVVAVGLAQSFLEPLEATSIHGTIAQLICLTEWLDQPGGRERHNATAARQVDDFRDFVRLHYVSERRDTAYWRDVTAAHPPEVTDRLAKWSRKFPSPSDFEPFPLGLAHVQEQLYVPVLDGLGLLGRDLARETMARDPASRRRAQETHAGLVAEYARAAQKCLPHRAWLQSLQKEAVA